MIIEDKTVALFFKNGNKIMPEIDTHNPERGPGRPPIFAMRKT